MAEDEDRPEDDIEDDDDSDLFQPPPPDKPDQEDGDHKQSSADAPDDPLGDALTQGAAGDTQEDSGDQDEEPHDEDDSELFEPPAGEGTTPGGHQPVLPATGQEDDDTGSDEDSDLFSGTAADQDDDEDEESDDGYGGARQRYPWLQTSGEEEEEPEEEHFLQGRALIIVGAGVVFVIFAALIWFLYAQGDEAPRDQDVALIEAPEGPAKVEPEDRGGMEVPDQDKLVFDRVSGEETEMEENLLAGPEETMPLPESAPESMDQLVEALVQGDAATDATADAGSEEDLAAPKPAEQLAAAEEPEIIAEPAPAEAAPAEAAPSPVAAAAAADGTHVVQLGSFGSAERAETAWLVMKNRHSITLAGLDNNIQRADLGARGIFYRLRTEALGQDDARDLCADLKADGQDCLVVRR